MENHHPNSYRDKEGVFAIALCILCIGIGLGLSGKDIEDDR